MVTWGLICVAMMFVRGPTSFYILRFLLGVAEAGFFPGIIYYLTQWFPRAERARAVSWFMTAVPLSVVVGGPLAGLLLSTNGLLGLRGWHWLFVLEGIPAILLGILALFYLTDAPDKANWLEPHERISLSEQIRTENAQAIAHHGVSLRQALVHPTVWSRLWCIWGFPARERYCRSPRISREGHGPFPLEGPIAQSAIGSTQHELPLANAMGEFDAGDRDGGVRERFEAGHLCTSALDRAMVLLDDVVQIAARSNLHVAPARVLASKQPQRATTRDVTVKRDLARHAWSNGGERFAKECLCGRDSAVSPQQEVDCLAVFVDGTVKVVPATADGNIRLIRSPGCPDGSRESAPAFLVLRHISENPSEDSGVCHANPALSH
jgi:hypothetical protein